MSKQELHPRTAVLNKSQKNHSKKLRLEALAWLAHQFPAVFDNSLCIRPLKAGIMDDILQHVDKAQAAGISRSKLREAVVVFTRRLDYLACLKAREMRVDLDGQEVTEVTQEEAEHAALKIRKRIEKSARNARKLLAGKTQPSAFSTNSHVNSSQTKVTNFSHEQDDHFPIYPARNTGYGSVNTTTQPAKVSSVIVKHKTTRQYDPSAVARLKEKLGLSRSLEEKKEAVE